MSDTTATRTLPIGSAAQALGVTRDNLYKHIERGRTYINGVPFSAQQGPDKRWKVSIPVDMSPYLTADSGDDMELAVDEISDTDSVMDMRAELEKLRRENEDIRVQLQIARAERDSYKGMIEATHHATLTTLERVVQKLSEPPALPEPKKRGLFWFGKK